MTRFERDAAKRQQTSLGEEWATGTAFADGFENEHSTLYDKWLSRRLTQTWQRVAVRGLSASLFGLLMVSWREFPLIVLVFVFGIFALLGRKWKLILSALLGVSVGLCAVAWPGLTTLALLYLVAGAVAAVGGLMVLHEIQVGRELGARSLTILDCALSFAFGALLSSLPSSGASAITWVVGMYVLVFGLLLDAFAYRMKNR